MSLDFYLTAHCDSCTDPKCQRGASVLDKNITHNLGAMWAEAGVYDALYETEGKRARDILPALRAGVAAMKADPARFEKHNSPNGWGLYKNALPWLCEVLEACEQWPNATIHISR